MKTQLFKCYRIQVISGGVNTFDGHKSLLCGLILKTLEPNKPCRHNYFFMQQKVFDKVLFFFNRPEFIRIIFIWSLISGYNCFKNLLLQQIVVNQYQFHF